MHFFLPNERLVVNHSTTWKRLQCGGFAVLVRTVLCRPKKLMRDIRMSKNVRGCACYGVLKPLFSAILRSYSGKKKDTHVAKIDYTYI